MRFGQQRDKMKLGTISINDTHTHTKKNIQKISSNHHLATDRQQPKKKKDRYMYIICNHKENCWITH